MKNIGDDFQAGTKYRRDEMEDGGLDWSSKPELYKVYKGADRIALPKAVELDRMSLDEAIRSRESVRRYANKEMSQEQLSYLLWASTGISRAKGRRQFRTAPSAGALYPIETYLCVNNVEGIGEGLYHYAIEDHGLEALKDGPFSVELANAALGQKMCVEAAVVFVWTAIFQRMKWKYGQRAYRYVYLDAGHIAENLALAAVSLGLGSCQIGAIFDDEADAVIDVDGAEESVIYMTTVGSPS